MMIQGKLVTFKQMVILPKGNKALLRFTKGRKKAFIEYYEPSPEYHRYIRKLQEQQTKLKKLSSVIYPDITLPVNKYRHCRYWAGVLINRIFRELAAKSTLHGSQNTIRAHQDDIS